MSGQVFPAFAAMVLGVLLGIVLFVPFVVVQYRRRGRLTLRRTLLWSGFLLYCLALWTYTLLPLPSPDEIVCAPAQLRPFQFVHDIFDYPAGSAGELARNPAIMQVALNVMLFVPLGFFVRLIWRRGFAVATAAGFATSLAIETTQLTGVWGLYPCSYRLFDVDDLMANTAGALLGGLLSVALRPWLSDRSAPAEATKPRPVTVPRRLLVMLCDVLSVWLLGGFAGVLVNVWRLYALNADPATLDQGPANIAATAVPLVVIGAVVLATGRTVGDLAVLIRWEGGVRPRALGRLLRYLGGIGGWQLLVLASPLDLLFVLASVIVLLSAHGRGGLPGVVSRMRPVDAREGHGAPAPR
ncbi:VanZ family protein [Glycomyces tenuis]|uniref:VanZ family protein n=1 Tax=Glycomyces tenuis TaxID=58116 RepID=UPI0003F81F68|nr:VanZ family protein [Glycomyces tenuis]